jgi:2,3-bisphosphoglycerate-dependent phosphoglycerate mutase
MERTLTERTNVWLVRHGESTWNALGLCQGQSDIARLTSRGRRQAVRATETLEHEDIELVYSSDLHRARETASLLAAGLRCGVVTDERLRERCFGEAEGSPLKALAPERTGIRGDRVVDIDARPTGGESLRDVQARCADFLHWLTEQGHRRDVVVVTHGGSLRMLRATGARAGVLPPVWDTVDNATVHRIDLPHPRYVTEPPQPHASTDGRDQ